MTLGLGVPLQAVQYATRDDPSPLLLLRLFVEAISDRNTGRPVVVMVATSCVTVRNPDEASDKASSPVSELIATPPTPTVFVRTCRGASFGCVTWPSAMFAEDMLPLMIWFEVIIAPASCSEVMLLLTICAP